MRAKMYYHVAPKFTSGSPAQVDSMTALYVAQQEVDAYFRNHGETESIEETNNDLRGIVYSSLEKYGKQYIEDIITTENFVVPNKDWEGHHWHSRPDKLTFRVLL